MIKSDSWDVIVVGGGGAGLAAAASASEAGARTIVLEKAGRNPGLFRFSLSYCVPVCHFMDLIFSLLR